MKNITAIKKVRALLADPKRWTKGWYARDKKLEPCECGNPGASSFCVGGATCKVLGADVFAISEILRQTIPQSFKPRAHKDYRVGYYNDSCSHRRMLQWLDRAIKIAGG